MGLRLFLSLVSVLTLTATSSVYAQDAANDHWPRLIVIAERGTPDGVAQQIARTLEEVGTNVSPDPYVRECRRRGLRWNQQSAFTQVLPSMNVDLLVSVRRSGRRASTTFELTYRDGKTGKTLLRAEHRAGAAWQRRALDERVVQEAKLVLSTKGTSTAAPTAAGAETEAEEAEAPNDTEQPEPSEEEQVEEPEPPDAVETDDVSSVVRFGLRAGIGMGGTSAKVAGSLGTRRLSVFPFAVAHLDLGVDVRPNPRGPLSGTLGFSYFSSVAMNTKDERGDGSTIEAPARTERLDLAGGIAWRLSPSAHPTMLGLELGYGFHIFSSPAVLTFPDHVYSGPLLRVGIYLPVADGRVTFAIRPEVQWLLAVSNAIEELGASSTAFSAGADASVGARISDTVSAEVIYAETHVLLSVPHGDGNEVTRYGVLRLAFMP